MVQAAPSTPPTHTVRADRFDKTSREGSWPAAKEASARERSCVFVGIREGRIIDHRSPRTVMTVSSVLCVLSILVFSAPNLPLFLVG
ncbi:MULTISPECIES: hypothetical protein [Streptomyces]|uniref:hypothetical protein n=1 Tax=Streptomyces TaxID=1883 RepID=UPI0011802690|nr:MULTISPECIES: hypothetical protein [Streptomyces]